MKLIFDNNSNFSNNGSHHTEVAYITFIPLSSKNFVLIFLYSSQYELPFSMVVAAVIVYRH